MCLFLVNDLAWANPFELLNPSQRVTLAPESRLKPFFEKHGLGLQNLVAVSEAAGRLRNLVRAGEVRENHIVRLNDELRKRLHGEAIEIGTAIETGSLTSGKRYMLAIFNFKKEGKKIKTLFLKDYTGSAGLTVEDLKELKSFGVETDADIGHLDYPGLEGVWFVNSAAAKRETAWQENLRSYLIALSNRKSDVEKVISLLSSGKPVLLEFGCGNAELAKAIAEKHPEIAIIATDIYDAADTNKTSYMRTALNWEKKSLAAQYFELPNLVILRSTAEALGVLPPKCLKYVMAIHPDPTWVENLLRSIHDNGTVLINGSHIYIKPFYEGKPGDFPEEYRNCGIDFKAISLSSVLDVDVTVYSTWFIGAPIYDGSIKNKDVSRLAAEKSPAEPAPAAQSVVRNDTTPTAATQAEAELAQAAHETIEETNRIHTENLNYTPTIPDKTVLCHVVTDSILPVQQRDMLKTLEQDMRNEKYSEKVVSLSIKDSNSPEEFMKELERIKAREEARYQGYKVQFDVACPNKDLVGKIQAKGIQALAFSKEGDGDIVQVEGIILALRVLQTGSINNLLNVYKLLTGRELTTGTNDINELARIMLFILPVRKVDVNAIGTLNRIIEENIKTAA